ncbi:MAG: hypothetical protein IJ356_04645 [Erysipelotrichaceae bacterium]|nr:hypothetical protein [Erysipelotrichaceae bacterium]
MPRKSYDEIKTKFAQFVETWKTKNAEALNNLATEEVACRISSSPGSNDSLDKLAGLKEFVATYPKTDELQLAIYSYACNFNETEAQQIAHVVCESLNYVEGKEELDAFYYGINCANHWVKTDSGWKMDEVHMDVYPFYWTVDSIYDYFKETWYLGSKLAIPQEDGRLPAVEGEFDLPWDRVPDGIDVLTEEEKLKECYAKLFFSADYMVSENRIITRSKHMGMNTSRYGEYDGIRSMVGSVRYKRQKDRYWAHPFRFGKNLYMNEEKTYAICDVYRVFGWKQRNHEYVWTRENVGIEHMCMGGWQEFVKEDGVWRVAAGNSKLGIYEVGPYSETYYGDMI